MTSNNYSIIFSSVTGNTKKLADTIHETLPQDMCDYFGGNELQVPESDLLYIGFWTDKGNADNKTLELLSKLKNKKIFCLEQPASVEATHILTKFLSRSDNLLIPAMRLSERICVRERCRSLCATVILK